MKEEN